jgi:hypothetical protein
MFVLLFPRKKRKTVLTVALEKSERPRAIETAFL